MKGLFAEPPCQTSRAEAAHSTRSLETRTTVLTQRVLAENDAHLAVLTNVTDLAGTPEVVTWTNGKELHRWNIVDVITVIITTTLLVLLSYN